MFQLFASIFKRVSTALTSPFRMFLVRFQRLFNINIITAKLISPLTKKVKELITLRPQSRSDYYVVGRFWVYKKLLLTVILVLCAAVLIYFTMFAPDLPTVPAQAAAVQTNVTFDYDDMDLREFTGVANIKAADGQVVYTGDIAAGVCKGVGTLKDRDGKLLYEGGFDQNQYNGNGTLYYPSGEVRYSGAFVNNQFEGEGTLYASDGKILYTGGFVAGQYSGTGKAYGEDGALIYEGGFSEGKYHGQGTSYYPGGLTQYSGDFFEGQPQGVGTFYSTSGKALYTGDMYAGNINYQSLVHSTLEDVETAFHETPRIFYTDTDSAFVYEQAGVIITVDCRVSVDTWQKEPDPEDAQQYYYMPGTLGEGTDGAGQDTVSQSGTNLWTVENSGDSALVLPDYIEEDQTQDAQTITLTGAALSLPRVTSAVAASWASSLTSPSLPLGDLRLVDWYVTDQAGNTTASGSSSSSGNTSSSGSSSSSSSSNSSGGQSVQIQYTPDSSTGSTQQEDQTDSNQPNVEIKPEISVTIPQTDTKPDFVQTENTLYFEIDAGVWQSEADLDKSKVQVKKVTVFDFDKVELPEDAQEYQDNAPASMEDCVAIDFIRQTVPTAFSQISFEMDRQNRLFVRMANINYAAKVDRRDYLVGELNYHYCYQEPGDETPAFFSIER